MAGSLGGAPFGNKNAAKSRLFDDALRRALKQRDLKDGDGETLRKIADKLIDMALAGDIGAFKEARDTIDGKPAQSIDLTADVTNRAATLTDDDLAEIARASSGPTPA